MSKKKAQYPEDFKTMFGVSTMSLIEALGSGMITANLMMYITDYSSIYQGVAGKAAAVAAIMLLIGRIWDSVNDPLLGFLMDRSPRTKMGRFKPFLLLATPLSAILLIALFNIPATVSDLVKVALLYVFYFLFDTVLTLLPYIPLTQTLSDDTRIRAKLITAPRVVSLLTYIPFIFFFPVAVAFGNDGVTPNFGMAIIVFTIPIAALSMLGVVLVKEGPGTAGEEPVAFKDFKALVKSNRPLWIYLLSGLFAGFTWTFIFAAQGYYMKYAFGVENLARIGPIFGGIMIFTILLGAIISQWLMKIKGMTPGLVWIGCNVLMFIPLVILWIINFAGPITNPLVYFSMLSIPMLGIGMNFVPGTLISMECMDYNKYKVGKSMEGTVNSLNKFVNKIQAAFASALTGAVLVAVGYDAAVFEQATTVPASLFQGLGLVLFGLPALFALLSLITILFYPLLKPSQRERMVAQMAQEKREDTSRASTADTAGIMSTTTPSA
jgi:Na+/melibiose symporter-like transporter